MSLSIPSVSSYPTSSTSEAARFGVYNPATGSLLTTVQGSDASTTRAAIEAAHVAYQTWRWRSPTERSLLLFKCADAVEKHAEELAELLCLENGKPYQDALMFDVKFVSEIFRYYGSIVDKLPSEFYDRGSVYCQVVREPLGVVAGVCCLW